jgi:hypothetical protein
MIGKKNLDRIFAICLAVVYGGLIIGGIPVFWFKGNFWLYLFLLTVVCGLLYMVGKWIRARGERNRKVPISSKELRRRTKAFYNWLDSQGRR